MSLSQESFESQLSASLQVYGASDEVGAGVVISFLGRIAETAIGILGNGKLDDATFNMLIAAAKSVLSKALTAAGFPPDLTNAALSLLVLIITNARTGS